MTKKLLYFYPSNIKYLFAAVVLQTMLVYTADPLLFHKKLKSQLRRDCTVLLIYIGTKPARQCVSYKKIPRHQ